ncbi:MAG: nucleotidyl transferase AbiEii/AbiGii toxin family protein [Legionella sp.]|nr:nucleotidyl transferase AbiEii/AbiGii toxin family protein [Legionella sp.]
MNEQALKDRLKHIAAEQNRSFQEVWKLFLLERFLVRLSHSKYNEQLVFKGGLLLSYYLVIARETTDIDLLARHFQAEMHQIQNILIEICNIPVNDSIDMSFECVDALDHNHMNYPGYRVKLNARYGKMRDRIQIDIGVGDVVESIQIDWPLFQYKAQPLFEDYISLHVYPVETIFSEKLETIIARGAANSRMKDFHDVILLCRKLTVIDREKLNNSIRKTFMTRDTTIEIPVVFSDDEYLRLQRLWAAHLRTLEASTKETLRLPENISSVVHEINTSLSHVMSFEE